MSDSPARATSAKAHASHARRMPKSAKAIASPVAAQSPLVALQSRAGNRATSMAMLGTGAPLPVRVREAMEVRFNTDFSSVRIHNDSQAHTSAADLHANAYTHGNDIVFGADQFGPQTGPGKWLLAHELAHVVQQRRGGAEPMLDANAPHEQAADVAANAVTVGSGPVAVAGASGVGVARQEKAESRERIKRNFSLANQLYNAVLSSPIVPDSAKKAVEGGNDWLKSKAAKLGITDEQREQAVSAIVETVGAPAVVSAQRLVAPVAAAPSQIAGSGATPPTPSDLNTPFDEANADPAAVQWLGNPTTRPRWTKEMRLWKDSKGNTNLSAPDIGLATWNSNGKRLNLPAPGADEVDRAMRASLELSRTNGLRNVVGKGALDEAQWRTHLQERRTLLAIDAKSEIEKLQAKTDDWAKTQNGGYYFASVPSHLLGNRWFGDPERIVADARQDVEIGLHEVDKALTPDQLADAESHVASATARAERSFHAHKEDVYTGADRTITGIKAAPFVVAVAGTAFSGAPLLAGAGLKTVATGAVVGGVLSTAGQMAQIYDGSRKDFSGQEILEGVGFGAVLPFVPGVMPLLAAGGAQQSADEFSQGHNATGLLGAVTTAAPVALKFAPSVAAWARPRAAAVGLRIGTALAPFNPAAGGRTFQRGGSSLVVELSPRLKSTSVSRPLGAVRPKTDAPSISGTPTEAVSAATPGSGLRTPTSSAPNAALILAAQTALTRLRAAKSSPHNIQVDDLNAVEDGIRQLARRQTSAPDPAVQSALEAVTNDYNDVVHDAVSLQGSGPTAVTGRTSAAQAKQDAHAAGLDELAQGRVGLQSHNTSPETRRVAGISGATHQSAHLVPQAVYKAIGASEGAALTLNLPKLTHGRMDRPWVLRWKSAIRRNRQITGADVQTWVSEGIQNTPDQMLPQVARNTLEWRLSLELKELGIGPDTVIVPGTP